MEGKHIFIIKELHHISWDLVKIKSCKLCNKDEAIELISIFIKCHGWRERVTAAKLVVAFDVYEMMEDLIKTFINHPESNTSSAFTQMILRSSVEDKEALLNTLKNEWADDEYGINMQNKIDKAIELISV